MSISYTQKKNNLGNRLKGQGRAIMTDDEIREANRLCWEEGMSAYTMSKRRIRRGPATIERHLCHTFAEYRERFKSEKTS